MNETVLILDFGSQYTQLIARRVRELKVYSEIKPYNLPIEEITRLNPKGIILSGSPASVCSPQAPIPDKRVFSLDIPILGICYGLQLMAYLFGGEVDRAQRREFGKAELVIDDKNEIFKGLGDSITVWMSHSDQLKKLPFGFEIIAHTDNSPIAAIRDPKRKFYGLQFHPEVVHTPQGKEILHNFLYEVCKCEGLWTTKSFLERSVQQIRERVRQGRVICGISGGVDSTVVATLVHRAIGDRLFPIFVDNGLLRKGEAQRVREIFTELFPSNFRFMDASKRFLRALKGVMDPEEKRRIIGETFIRIFEEEAEKIGGVRYLAQGTLYPDVIESLSTVGPSATIKTHHNVGGLPEEMRFDLIEPLRELFKDEVREVGRELGLPEEILRRHPFPGPGLAVRILGEVTQERLETLRQADEIFIGELKKTGWYDRIWQAFAVLLPVRSVGVMGDERTYANVLALRAVASRDGMTADWAKLPGDLLGRIANRIINEVEGVNRVVYDISSKPPSTIEWE